MLGRGGLQLHRVTGKGLTEKMTKEAGLKEAWEGACCHLRDEW